MLLDIITNADIKENYFANIGKYWCRHTRALRKIRISAVAATVVINQHHIQVTAGVKTQAHFALLSDIKVFQQMSVNICRNLKRQKQGLKKQLKAGVKRQAHFI